MCISKCKKWWLLTTGLGIFILLGCNAKPYDYQPTAGEMKPGPGVFSGKEGEITVYDSEKGGLFPKEGQAEPQKTTAAATQATQNTEISPETAEEFEEFQQWKKEKEQFHEYQEWKKSSTGSADFQEFQEYQEWKKTAKGSGDYKEFQEWKEFKSYQEWKQRQKK